MTPEEVNRFLAEKLMGWHIRPLSDKERLQGFERIPIYHKENGEQSGYSATGQCNTIRFDPYHNITQALGDGGPRTVVGEMKKLGWTFYLLDYVTYWHAQFFTGENTWKRLGDANTPAAAICLAAVKALGGK